MSIRNALEELLLIVETHQKCTKNNFAWAEVAYAKELLAQSEQEPVAWRYKTHNRYTYAEENYHELEGEPLYTSPQKREPLTDSEISEGFRADKEAINAESYWAGVALAEKHYGKNK